MKTRLFSFGAVSCVIFLLAAAQIAQSDVIWTCGLDDNAHPTSGAGGGPDASFVQENGATNPLPGSPFSTPEARGADNDYYFAGDFSIVIEANGVYDPVGVVDADEIAAERAYAGGDLDLRYHFNLPATLKPTDLISVTFDALSLDGSGSDPRYGVEVYINGVKVQDQILIRVPQFDIDYTTPAVTLEQVNAQVGPGYDNIVSLRGTSYNSEGGGNWMGIDYVQLNHETVRTPQPVLPWGVGQDDNAWSVGDGGGTNATFVEGNGSVNVLPGSATSTEVKGGADNDYYLGGLYTNVIAGNGAYEPVGLVLKDEEAAERGFAGAENELRYHFNLPNTLLPSDSLSVTFDALSLDAGGANPRYGVEVYVNGVRVQPEVLIGTAQLHKPITTPAFTLASVNARVGSGHDNIISLRGISHSAEGGGDSLGIDFVQVKLATPIPVTPLPWSVGLNDNGWPAGNGGGPYASFVQENDVVNPLPGSPNSPEVNQQADNDYYFAGIYSTVIPGNGSYQPVGEVRANEEAAERAFVGAANELRYHCNLPSTLNSNSLLSVAFDVLNLDDTAADPHYGVEVYFNNVLVRTQTVIRVGDLNQGIFTQPFTVAQVNAQVGPGYDNIVSLKGVNYSAEGGGNWMGIDYIQLNAVVPAPFPWDIGRDDNGWPSGNGGGINASFVQEAGSNPLPGNPASPELDRQADDDYYFVGDYTKTIASVVASEGEYVPVGTVLVNEEAAERAFAGSDNNKRYHFNLPATLKPTDQLLLTFDFNNLDDTADISTRQYGAEIYFNSVLIQPELIITPEKLDVDYTVGPFTLASVNAEVGSGWDNIITLKGINHSGEGGGGWMGIDYVQLSPMPQPVFPWAVGANDNRHAVGDGGGLNATFVQENGSINDLPGRPNNVEVNMQADNDYYFAGSYTNVLAANGSYEPVGIVPRNEEAAERAFAGADNDLRYHFNLPSTLKLTNQVAVSFNVLDLDTSVEDARYGIEVYFNNVLVQPEIVIRTNLLDIDYTTPPFTLASVNAQLGPGSDNIVSLRGVNYSADGGGNWMGIDSVQLIAAGGAPPKFTSSTVSNGKITLTWTGTGNLEWAPALAPGVQWTPVIPVPTSPYTEDVLPGQTGRFYRLKQ